MHCRCYYLWWPEWRGLHSHQGLGAGGTLWKRKGRGGKSPTESLKARKWNFEVGVVTDHVTLKCYKKPFLSIHYNKTPDINHMTLT